MDAAANAGHKPAQREIEALYGSDEDDEGEEDDEDEGDLTLSSSWSFDLREDEWYRDHYDEKSEDDYD